MTSLDVLVVADPTSGTGRPARCHDGSTSWPTRLEAGRVTTRRIEIAGP